MLLLLRDTAQEVGSKTSEAGFQPRWHMPVVQHNWHCDVGQ
jgi:hypothetical protein